MMMKMMMTSWQVDDGVQLPLNIADGRYRKCVTFLHSDEMRLQTYFHDARIYNLTLLSIFNIFSSYVCRNANDL